MEEALAAHFELTPTDRAQMLPSGQTGIFVNRVGWARTDLKKAVLIESPKRGVFKDSNSSTVIPTVVETEATPEEAIPTASMRRSLSPKDLLPKWC